ncbi:MAG: hypothetical protein CL902_13850 [Dehalococcoidia bacterium]|nr:hypothetical protein [Dehalococcoidia bacterium]
MEPTFNSTIEPHPTPTRTELVSEIVPIYTPPPPSREELSLPSEPIKPHRQPAMGPGDWTEPVPLPCCGRGCELPSASTFDSDPLAMFNALGAALGLGVAIGGLLVYAFSRPTVIEVLE